MATHTMAKIAKAEEAAEKAGLMGEWIEITWIMDLINQVYGFPPEEQATRVRSIDGVYRVAKACYS